MMLASSYCDGHWELTWDGLEVLSVMESWNSVDVSGYLKVLI